MFSSLQRAKVLASRLIPFHFKQNSSEQTAVPQEPPSSTMPKPEQNPMLALSWPDGLQDNHELPPTGELTIGNIVIRRARVHYYLERIDNAFPVLLNGEFIGRSHLLNDGDVLQIGELETVFQLAA